MILVIYDKLLVFLSVTSTVIFLFSSDDVVEESYIIFRLSDENINNSCFAHATVFFVDELLSQTVLADFEFHGNLKLKL